MKVDKKPIFTGMKTVNIISLFGEKGKVFPCAGGLLPRRMTLRLYTLQLAKILSILIQTVFVGCINAVSCTG
jgi:hypothetical protein